MLIKNTKYANKSLVIAGGQITFDEKGVTEVTPDEFAEKLLKLNGFSAVENQNPAKSDEVEPTEEDNTPKEENQTEDKNISSEDNAEDDLESKLNKLNVPQLKKYAKEQNIDLGDVSKKDDIIKLIVEASK